MTIAYPGLKVKVTLVKVKGQNAVGATLIEGNCS